MNVVLLQDIPLTKISNKNVVETRNFEVGLTIAPRTFTSCEIFGGCRDVTPANEKYYLKSFQRCHVKPDNEPLEMKYVYC